MVLSFWTQSVTRIRPGTRTERGSTVFDWNNADEKVIGGCSVQPASTSLSQDGRVLGVTDGLTAYLPPDADVQAGDRIVFGGKTYTINGDPLAWPSATGDLDHLHLNLVRWRG